MLCSADFSHKGISPVPSIPWDELATNPGRYFDMSLHRLPVPLRSPDAMKGSPLTAFALHDYFSKTIADLRPFQFHQKHPVALDNDPAFPDSEAADPPNTSVCCPNSLASIPGSSPATSATAFADPITPDLPLDTVDATVDISDAPFAAVINEPKGRQKGRLTHSKRAQTRPANSLPLNSVSTPSDEVSLTTVPLSKPSAPDVETAMLPTSSTAPSARATPQATSASDPLFTLPTTIPPGPSPITSTPSEPLDANMGAETLKELATSESTKARPIGCGRAKRLSAQVSASANPTVVATPSGSTQPSSASTRTTRSSRTGEKRKQPDTVTQEIQEGEAGKKKKKPGFYYITVDAAGNPIKTGKI